MGMGGAPSYPACMNYTIETDGGGGLRVRVTDRDDQVRIISHQLPNWGAAQDWIAQHRRQSRPPDASSSLPSK